MANKPQTLSKGQEEHVVQILRRKLLTWVLACFTVLTGVTGASLWGIWARVENKMDALVAKQFEAPEIGVVVRQAASERASALISEEIAPEVAKFRNDVAAQLKESQTQVDLVGQEASKAKALSEEVADRNRQADERLGALDTAIAKATSMLAQLESSSEFMMTVVAAQNDDRRSFDKLEAWSKDETYSLRDMARQAREEIRAAHTAPYSWMRGKLELTEHYDPTKVKLSDLVAIYSKTPAKFRDALIDHISKREDIPVVERLDFLVNVIEHDDSLHVVEIAGRRFTEATGQQQFSPVDVEAILKWWAENRAEFGKK